MMTVGNTVLEAPIMNTITLPTFSSGTSMTSQTIEESSQGNTFISLILSIGTLVIFH